MPCLLVVLALLMPRVVILLVAIFSTYLHRAYDTWVWPVLGFLFMPLTTLAYAYAHNATGGRISGLPLVVVVLAVLIDLGLIGGSGHAGRRRRRRRRR